jgi:arylsulfatase A-like enzyme
MTGRYAHNHGVKSNSHPEEGGADNLDHPTTLHAYLQQAGYRTGIVGKFLNPPWQLADNPPYFDEWLTLGGEPRQRKYYDALFNDNGLVREIPGYTTTVIRRRARSFIRRNADQPWYLYVAPKAPHPPAVPETRYADTPVPHWDGNPAVFERYEQDKPLYVRRADRDLQSARRVRSAQYRSLPSVDDMVGAIFEELAELGERRDTLAFFISDNGNMWSEHGLSGKGVPYYQAVTVPFFASWPGHIARDTTDSRFAANIDIAPTALQAAGIQPTAQDGRSLLEDWRRDRLLLEYWCNSETMACNRWASSWTRKYQYTEYYEDGTVSFREFYNLQTDRWQLLNLLGDQDLRNDPSLTTLEEQLAADKSCAGAACP